MLLIICAIFIAVFVFLEVIRRKLPEKNHTEYQNMSEYNAIILDVHREKRKKVAIVQFRDEEHKKTTVYKYTGVFTKRYNRGDKIVLLFDEQTDKGVIKDDNNYTLKGRLFLVSEIISAAAALVFGVLNFL